MSKLVGLLLLSWIVTVSAKSSATWADVKACSIKRTEDLHEACAPKLDPRYADAFLQCIKDHVNTLTTIKEKLLRENGAKVNDQTLCWKNPPPSADSAAANSADGKEAKPIRRRKREPDVSNSESGTKQKASAMDIETRDKMVTYLQCVHETKKAQGPINDNDPACGATCELPTNEGFKKAVYTSNMATMILSVKTAREKLTPCLQQAIKDAHLE